MARKHGRLPAEQFGGSHPRATGERAHGLLAHGDHDAGRRRGQSVDVGSITADRPGSVGEQRIVTRPVVLLGIPSRAGSDVALCAAGRSCTGCCSRRR